jgi:hypothetical protein
MAYRLGTGWGPSRRSLPRRPRQPYHPLPTRLRYHRPVRPPLSCRLLLLPLQRCHHSRRIPQRRQPVSCRHCLLARRYLPAHHCLQPHHRPRRHRPPPRPWWCLLLRSNRPQTKTNRRKPPALNSPPRPIATMTSLLSIVSLGRSCATGIRWQERAERRAPNQLA